MPAERFRDIKVVGFDLDQTLYPKSPAIDEKIQEYLYARIAEHLGVSHGEARQLFEERYQGGAGMTGTQSMRDLGIPDPGATVQEALERADIGSILEPDPELHQLIAEIREKYGNVDIITGCDAEDARKKLAAIGLDEKSFGTIITADRASKSTGESYELWLSLYPQYEPHNFLYIGDRIRSDHEIPSALGIETMLVYVKSPDASVPCVQCASLFDIRTYLL